MRPRFNVDERRTTPWTSYPFASKSSARYEPSWPVIPVISAVFGIGRTKVYCLCYLAREVRNFRRGLVIPRTAFGANGAMRQISQKRGGFERFSLLGCPPQTRSPWLRV